jgi:hypothetical protein
MTGSQTSRQNGLLEALPRPAALRQLNNHLAFIFFGGVGCRPLSRGILLPLPNPPQKIVAHVEAPALDRLLALCGWLLRRVLCGRLVRFLIRSKDNNGLAYFLLF